MMDASLGLSLRRTPGLKAVPFKARSPQRGAFAGRRSGSVQTYRAAPSLDGDAWLCRSQLADDRRAVEALAAEDRQHFLDRFGRARHQQTAAGLGIGQQGLLCRADCGAEL